MGLRLAPLPVMPKETTRPGKRINRVVELWRKGQPVYYASTDEGGFENGKKMAATKADYINYGMESGPLDFTKLSEFMRGLVAGGPTRSGHRFPVVIVTLPIPGTLEAMRANAWMIQQTLATGAHGILLCNAESAEAVRLMIQAARYPFAPRVAGIPQGTRGNGSQGNPAEVWGIDASEYMRIAEPWPMNPDGELIFGVKIENPRADVNVDQILAVPGLAFVEHGPGDNGFYFLGRPGSPERAKATNASMDIIRTRVFAAARKNKLAFLSGCNENTVEALIKEGIMICTGGDTPAADKGRAFSKRTDPW
jgi:4-hydroxy-2-oxoheptanedioate aldolase